jgi:hypothetical protein
MVADYTKWSSQAGMAGQRFITRKLTSKKIQFDFGRKFEINRVIFGKSTRNTP